MTDFPSAIPDATMVSRSGTRHIVGPQSGDVTGRVRAMCGFTLYSEEEPLEALRDCEFCQREAFVAARRQAAEEEERERIRIEKANAFPDQILN